MTSTEQQILRMTPVAAPPEQKSAVVALSVTVQPPAPGAMRTVRVAA